jgi:hypothetical protein
MNAPACCVKKEPRNPLRLLLPFGVLVVVSTGVFAQRKPLTPAERKDLEQRVEKMQPLLDEFHQGKRDDSDGHAIVRKMLQYYSILGSTNTATFQGLLKEWQSLRQKHPEFVTSPPLELHEHTERRANYKKHADEIAARAQHFAPKDARATLFWSGKRLAAVFQRRIEFYEIPDGVNFVAVHGSTDNIEPVHLHRREGAQVDSLSFRRGQTPVNLTPRKVITFGRMLTGSGWTSYGAFAVTASTNGYIANDGDEQEILKRLDDDKRPFTWNNPTADYQEFYGVISVDGKVLTEIPFKSTSSAIMQALYSAPDGTVLFGIGSYVELKGEDPEDYGAVFGNVSKVVSWTKEKGIQYLSVSEALDRYPEMKRWQSHLWAK